MFYIRNCPLGTETQLDTHFSEHNNMLMHTHCRAFIDMVLEFIVTLSVSLPVCFVVTNRIIRVNFKSEENVLETRVPVESINTFWVL